MKIPKRAKVYKNFSRQQSLVATILAVLFFLLPLGQVFATQLEQPSERMKPFTINDDKIPLLDYGDNLYNLEIYFSKTVTNVKDSNNQSVTEVFENVTIKSASIITSNDPKQFPLQKVSDTSKFTNPAKKASNNQPTEHEAGFVIFSNYQVNPLAEPGRYYIPVEIHYEENKILKTQIAYFTVDIGEAGPPAGEGDGEGQKPEPTKDPNKPPGEGVEKPALPDPVNRKSMLMIKEGTVPRLELGQEYQLVLPIINRGDQYVRIVNITPQTPLDDSYPFEILQSDYTKQLELLLAPQGALGLDLYGVSIDAGIDFGKMYVKSDLKKGYYKVDFVVKFQDFMTKKDIIYYNEYEGLYYSHEGYKIDLPEDFSEITLSLIVYVNGVGEEKPTDDVKIPTPRLISTGFTTTPEKIYGGDNFTLRLMLQNTSSATNVQNIRINFDSGDGTPFLPVDGASTKYIQNIPAGGTYELILELKAAPNLEEKIYPLNLAFEYEDYKTGTYTANETLSIQLLQETRVSISNIQTYPGTLMSGQEGSLNFSLINKGKKTLSNATITFPEDSPLSAQEMFLGNVEPGAAKDVDITVMPTRESFGEPIVMLLNYEDADGKKVTLQEELTFDIMPEENFDDMPPDFPPDGEMPGFEEEGRNSLLPTWAWIVLILLLLILLITLLTAFLRRRKRKRQAEEDAEFFKQLDEERQARANGTSAPVSPPPTKRVRKSRRPRVKE
ncbi:MAG: hypothetical protein Q4P65_00865 [Eubacteriales bacterium]|nr:hypothetical protein [Eubacteriales bacterium]